MTILPISDFSEPEHNPDWYALWEAGEITGEEFVELDPVGAREVFGNERYEAAVEEAAIEKMGGSARIKGRSRSLLWPRVYDALRREGMDKEKAAKISNAHWNKYRRWGKAGKPGPRSMAERKSLLKKGEWHAGEEWYEGWDDFFDDADITQIARMLMVDEDVAAVDAEIGKYDKNQPRDADGKWTSGGGGKKTKDVKAGGGGSAGGGASSKKVKGTGTEKDPYVTSDVDEAARLIGENKFVRLDRPEEVGTLVRKLKELVDDAKAKGEDAPDYDLCRVSVPGTNLFCAKHKGIPRAQMPQLSGVPTAGSEADKLPKKVNKDGKGEVDLGPSFVEHLEGELGIDVEVTKMPASHLHASQSQINGGKVAGMAFAIEDGKLPPGSIFVTRDGYVVDGHHRWAANVGVGLMNNDDVDIDVKIIDIDIITALRLANDFAKKKGIPQSSVSKAYRPVAVTINERTSS